MFFTKQHANRIVVRLIKEEFRKVVNPKVFCEEDEKVRYRKRSKHNSPHKIKHKHIFQPCVFEYESKGLDKIHGFIPKQEVTIGAYCTICGKTSSAVEEKWLSWVPMKEGSRIGRYDYTEDARKEFDSNTRTLPTFRLEDGRFQKFVSL